MLPRGVRVLQHRLSAVVILSDNVVSTQRENDQTFIGPIEAAWIRWRVRRSIAAVLANGKLSIIVLTLLAALIVAQRARTYDEPLENDVAGYAVIAREMLHGRSLYSDLWERKPPLLYVIFAGAELTVGPGRPAVFLVNVMAATADLLAIYFAARAMSGVSAGLFASALWTILGGDLYLQANQPNAEALANPFITAAIAMLLFQLNRPEQRRWWFALLIGLLLGSATLIKHHLVLSAGIILAGFLLAGDRVTWKGRLRVIAVSVTTITLCWAAVAIYFAVTNRLGPFVEILAGQNITYAGNPLLNVIHSLSPGAILTVRPGWMFAPLTLAAASFFLSDRMWLDRNCVLLVAWAVAAWIAEALPGHLFPHYFQYWLPFWCVIGGAAAAALADKHAGAKLFRRGVIFIAFAVAAIRQCSQLRLTPDQWADTKYPGGNYTQQKYLGRYLKEHVLKPRDTFWVAGDDASLYLEACVSPPTGLLYVDPLIGGPHAADYNRRLVSDLTAHPPALILLTPLIERFPADAPIFEFIRDRYRPWSTTIGGRMYHVYIRD